MRDWNGRVLVGIGCGAANGVWMWGSDGVKGDDSNEFGEAKKVNGGLGSVGERGWVLSSGLGY